MAYLHVALHVGRGVNLLKSFLPLTRVNSFGLHHILEASDYHAFSITVFLAPAWQHEGLMSSAFASA